MNMPSVPHKVSGVIDYHPIPSCPLFSYFKDPPAGTPVTNTSYEPTEQFFFDNRVIPQPMRLETNGFAFLRHVSSVQDFNDESEVTAQYHAELCDLVKESIGANHAVVIEHIRRKRVPGAHDTGDEAKPRQPVTRVHADFTQKSAIQVFEKLVSEGTLRSNHAKRIAIVNVWRPTHRPVFDMPLGVCDSITVRDSDVFPLDLIFPDRTIQILLAQFTPQHRWHYLSRMDRDDALLIKSYDSSSNVSQFALHASFELPPTDEAYAPRESIEARVLALF